MTIQRSRENVRRYEGPEPLTSSVCCPKVNYGRYPDLTSRYLEEIGWFLYYQNSRRDQFGGSYEAERLAYSRLLLAEVADYLGRDVSWVEGKTVVSLGCDRAGDLAAFPAAVKIAIDPLLYGISSSEARARRDRQPELYLSLGARIVPLLDDFADPSSVGTRSITCRTRRTP